NFCLTTTSTRSRHLVGKPPRTLPARAEGVIEGWKVRLKKTFPRRNFLHLAAGAAVLPVSSRFAWAQAYPSRPVRIIVGAAPSGANDIMARLIGQWLSERLGQPFVIENRPGAATNIGTEAVVRAPAHRYTPLLCSTPNATNAALYDKLSFNFIRDIAPVAGISREPHVMVVNPLVPTRTWTHKQTNVRIEGHSRCGGDDYDKGIKSIQTRRCAR